MRKATQSGTRTGGAFSEPPEGLAPPRLRSRAGEDSHLSSEPQPAVVLFGRPQEADQTQPVAWKRCRRRKGCPRRPEGFLGARAGWERSHQGRPHRRGRGLGGPALGEGDVREHGRGQQSCWGSGGCGGCEGGPGGQVTLAARLGEELDCGRQRLVTVTPGEQVQRPAAGRSDTDTRQEVADGSDTGGRAERTARPHCRRLRPGHGEPAGGGPRDAAENGTAGRGQGGITDRQGPPRWPGRPARSRGPAVRPRWVCGPRGTVPAAAAQCSPPLPPRPQSGARPCLSHGQTPWHPAPRCPERVPGCPHLGRRPGRPVSLSCPRGTEEGCSRHGPLWHRLNRETRGCGSPGTGRLAYSLLCCALPPRRPHQEGCLPGGIGPADLAACLQGSRESLPAAGSPRGGHCSSRAQLHLRLQEARAALSLSHRVGGGEGRGCEGARLPTCRGAASASDGPFAHRGGRAPPSCSSEQPLMSPGWGAGVQPSLVLWAWGQPQRVGIRVPARMPPRGGCAPGCLPRAQGQLPRDTCEAVRESSLGLCLP